MKSKIWISIYCLWILSLLPSSAQEYTGISGLIHTLSAEINPVGTARIGGFFLNKDFLPDVMTCQSGGEKAKYDSYNHFVSVVPFSWIELAYTCTLLKRERVTGDGHPKFQMKDRYMSVKIRLLKEGRWHPAIAIGSNDPYHFSSKETPDYYTNFYLAATKHLNLKGHELGIHVSYRWYKEETNRKWQGITGGLTYRPAFARNLRGIVEYTGNDINIGADCYLWKLLFLQASLQNGKDFSGGIMLQIRL
ncbi:MAG: YjbH domain-containing protein [Bacteroidales bacterium]|nr:YjbH domain-containing protein [Bacteroidales bacterium]